jgi:class 3 adenylate cyclase/pimeloyl-ACP methyl ester carboxylesterase
MEEPPVQYAKTSDGVSIAYWVIGAGEPPLVMSSPLAWSHISLEWRSTQLAAWYEHLASGRMLVRYDQRNQGLSDRNVERLSHGDQASDVEAVIERLGVTQVDLLGFYAPGAAMVRVAAEHPAKVRKLALWDANVFGKGFFGTDRMLAIRGLIDTDWELFTETFAHAGLGWGSDDAQDWARFTRRAVGRRDAALLMDAFIEADWRPWLDRIRAPTLVLRSQWSVRAGEGKWADISDVQVVSLQDRLVYQSEVGRNAIASFFGKGEKAALSARATDLPSGTAVILFADIVDSTALTERMGDTAFREKARALDAALRTVVREASGVPVEGKLLGDGVLAVFTSAWKAIEAALGCQARGESIGLPLHLGVHAGDVIREERNVYGGAVNIAARISAESAPGELLVSQTVRDLARTSGGVSFEDRGERELKGVGDPVRVWRVLRREPRT